MHHATIDIQPRDAERYNVIITQAGRKPWDCEPEADPATYATYGHEYFVRYVNTNTETGATYEGLAHTWNCKRDGLPSAHNLSRWMMAHNALMRSCGAPYLQVLTASVNRTRGDERIVSL